MLITVQNEHPKGMRVFYIVSLVALGAVAQNDCDLYATFEEYNGECMFNCDNNYIEISIK